MSTITRERAELKSFITGFLSDPMHDDQSAKSMTAEVFRIALASLEAAPVAFINGAREPVMYGEHIGIPIGTHLYTAPPAPVAVPDEVLARLEHEANHLTAWHHIDEHSCKVFRRDLLTLVNACRAAMLPGDK